MDEQTDKTHSNNNIDNVSRNSPSDILDVMSSCDDLGGPRAQAVAGGLWHDGAASHEVIVLVGEDAGF